MKANGVLRSGELSPAMSVSGADHIFLEPPTVSAVASDGLVSPTATSDTIKPLTSVHTLTTSTVTCRTHQELNCQNLQYFRKFSGDPAKWSNFWDMFEASVHIDSTLFPIDKFNYLASFLESAAAEAISGPALTSTSGNYGEAIATLKR